MNDISVSSSFHTMIPSSFSIDFLTRKEKRRSDGEDSLRQTPSPVNSSSSSENSESIAQVLLSLDRSIKGNFAADTGEKPAHSYIALISMAILSSPGKKMLLCDIYQYIMDNFAYYNNKEKAWRNSIRHNLSLNECFVKNGRSDNGKGNYWSIHPACEEDFSRGDFRRRQARRRARKSMKTIDTFDGHCGSRMSNMGYVPMTSSPVGYHPYVHSTASMYLPPTSYSFSSPITTQCAVVSSTPFFQASPIDYHQNVPIQQNFSSAW